MTLAGNFIISRLLRTIVLYVAIIIMTFFVLLLPMFLYGARPTYLLGEFFIQFRHGFDIVLQDDIAKWGIVSNPDVAEWINIFSRHVMNCVSGDYGHSFVTLRSVSLELSERVINTALLVGGSLFASLIIGCGLVSYQEGNERGKKSWIGQILSQITESTPFYWVGMLVLFAGSYALPDLMGFGFPQFGTISYEVWEASLTTGAGGALLFFDVIFHLLLPMIVLILCGSSVVYSILKSNLSENMTLERVRDGNANGQSTDYIFYSCLKKSLTVIKEWLPFFISTVVLVEIVFTWRGIGRYLFDSILRMDYPVIRGAIITLSLFVILAQLIFDMAFYIMTKLETSLTRMERNNLETMDSDRLIIRKL